MAETFNVTRDVLQEIAEHGAYQLPKDLIPPYDEFSKSLVSFVLSLDEFDIEEELSGYEAWRCLEDIIEFESDGEMIIVSANAEGHEERSRIPNPGLLHRDAYGQALSLVWMTGSPEDRLDIHGRGEVPTPSPIAQYLYRNGPILLAGDDFGKRFVNADIPVGPAWHFGKGTSAGMPFFAVDAYTTHTSPALPQHMSSALVGSDL